MATAQSVVLSYNPPPNEQGYYESLFEVADYAKTGQLNGRDAVGFLSRSKLPIDVLKNIWTMVDNPKTNYLDKAKFFASVRLIQFFQNGQKAQSADLATSASPMRPPYFEGVSAEPSTLESSAVAQQQPPVSQQPVEAPAPPVVSQPPPQQMMTQAHSSMLSTPAPPTVTPSVPPPQQMPAAVPSQQTIHAAAPSAPSTPGRRQMVASDPSQRSMHTTSALSQQQPPPPEQQPMYGGGAMQEQQNQQTALAALDPFNMQPVEQARYDDLFPRYASEDGHVYGQQAVELFSKSGLEKETLRDIWNLVDNPVDNRLSKMEFSIAMHLIICVSKKNLALPNVLPPSLQGRKDNDAPVPPAPPQVGFVAASNDQVPNAATGNPQLTGPPSLNSSVLQQPQLQSAPANRGMAITDAFSDMDSMNQHEMPSTQAAVAEVDNFEVRPPPQQPQPVLLPGNPPPNEISINNENDVRGASIVSEIVSSPALLSAPQVTPVLPDLNLPPASSNAMMVQNLATQREAPTGVEGGAVEVGVKQEGELDRVRAVLQRLQAENVALKAQLGQFTDEEKQVQQEIARTVSEIGTLSQELTTLRNQVVDAKSSLIEATAELKAQIEKRDTLKDLVQETAATKNAIESGSHSIREVEATAKVNQSQQSQSVEHDFFSFDAAAPNSGNSVNNDGYVDVSASYYGVATTSANVFGGAPTEQVMGGNMGNYTNTAPNSPGTSASHQPETQVAPTPVPNNNDNDIRSIEMLKELEQLKEHATQAEKEANFSDDHARALNMALDDLRSDLEKAEQIVTEKQEQLQKKRGFLRGSNKGLKREIEAAQQIVLEKGQLYEESQASFASAQNDVMRLKRQAIDIRREADALANAVEASQQQEVAPPPNMAMNQPVLATNERNYQQQQQQQQDFRNVPNASQSATIAVNMAQPNTYANPHTSISQQSGVAPMGSGGFPGTPGRSREKVRDSNNQQQYVENPQHEYMIQNFPGTNSPSPRHRPTSTGSLSTGLSYSTEQTSNNSGENIAVPALQPPPPVIEEMEEVTPIIDNTKVFEGNTGIENEAGAQYLVSEVNNNFQNHATEGPETVVANNPYLQSVVDANTNVEYPNNVMPGIMDNTAASPRTMEQQSLTSSWAAEATTAINSNHNMREVVNNPQINSLSPNNTAASSTPSIVSQNDGGDNQSLKSVFSDKITPSVASDPGYSIQNDYGLGIGGKNYRRSSYGDTSKTRNDIATALSGIKEVESGLISSSEHGSALRTSDTYVAAPIVSSKSDDVGLYMRPNNEGFDSFGGIPTPKSYENASKGFESVINSNKGFGSTTQNEGFSADNQYDPWAVTQSQSYNTQKSDLTGNDVGCCGLGAGFNKASTSPKDSGENRMLPPAGPFSS